MTLRELADELAGGTERLLTLQEVAATTGESYHLVRQWVYTDKVLPTVLYGPKRRRRVRAVVVLQLFAPHLLAPPEPPPRPVSYMPSPMRRCNPMV